MDTANLPGCCCDRRSAGLDDAGSHEPTVSYHCASVRHKPPLIGAGTDWRSDWLCTAYCEPLRHLRLHRPLDIQRKSWSRFAQHFSASKACHWALRGDDRGDPGGAEELADQSPGGCVGVQPLPAESAIGFRCGVRQVRAVWSDIGKLRNGCADGLPGCVDDCGRAQASGAWRSLDLSGRRYRKRLARLFAPILLFCLFCGRRPTHG